MPYLVHKDRDGSFIQFWNLHEGPTTVGCGDEANAKIEDVALSKTHFTITNEPGGFTLKDLGSKGGTLVNGQGVTQHVLKTNDQIRAGDSTFLFTAGLSTMAGELDEDISRLGKLGPGSKGTRKK